MKTPQQWLNYYWVPAQLTGLEQTNYLSMIEEIQKDAYNQAIDDAALNIKAEIRTEWSGNTGSEYCDDYVFIDKESILKLKKQ